MKAIFTVLLLCSVALGQEQGKKIPLEQIASDFNSNPARAEMLYRGKSIVVGGTILSINMSRDNRYKSQVALIEFQPAGGKSGTAVTSNSWFCGFDASHLKEIYKVKNSDAIILSGQFENLWHLQHCTVISDKSVVATTPTLDGKLGFFPPTHNDGCPSPIEAVKIMPRLYAFRVSTPGEEGWRPLNKMALDLTVKNVSGKDIAAVSFQLNYPDRLHPDMVPTEWDDVPVQIRAGEEYSLHFPNLVDILGGANAVTVNVTKVRYQDGMIVDVSFCSLGKAPFPPPFQPPAAQTNSPIQPIGNDILPARILESHQISVPPEELRKVRGKKLILSVIIGENGEPRDIKIKQGTLDSVVNEAAVEALQKWNFAPAMKNNKPVTVQVDIAFNLGPSVSPHVTVKRSGPIEVPQSSGVGFTKSLGSAFLGGGGNRGGWISVPQLLGNPPDPVYPPDAQNSGTEGTVLLRMEVDKNGLPQKVAVVKSAGKSLDESALETVSKWKFSPSLKNNTSPVAVQINVKIGFALY